MQSRLLYYVALLLLPSCSPDDPEEPQTVSSIRFSVNGTTYAWNEVPDSRSPDFFSMVIFPLDGNVQYSFAGTNGMSTTQYPSRAVFFPIPTTFLSLNTPYTFTKSAIADNPTCLISVSATAAYEPLNAYMALPGNTITATITRIHDRRIDGTFSGHLSRVSDSSQADITNGSFENVWLSD